LKTARHLLIVGDNSGEIGFDLVLMEEIRKHSDIDMFYMVRGAPILNDVTIDDARFFKIDEIATLLSSDLMIPGTPLDKLSDRRRKQLLEMDIIISKGQGNLETLAPVPRPIFFLLTVKCPPLARYLNVPLQSQIFKYIDVI